MISFESLFGQKQDEIKETCILVPFLTKGMREKLGIQQWSKGHPYASGNGESFTLILTRMGPAFLGDCILYLKDTPCKDIILIGACGLVQKKGNLDLGSIVAPGQSLCLESFSRLVNNQVPHIPISGHANPALLEKLRQCTKEQPIPVVNCASFGSFKLEENYAGYLKKENIDVVEMECCALFEAARWIGRRALALLYVTDIIGTSHPFRAFSEEEQAVIAAAEDKIIKLLSDFTHRL